MDKNRRLETKNGGSAIGIRHLQCFLMCTGFIIAYAVRVNFFVAIIAMMDKNAANPDFNEYAWSEKTKSLLLSSFFWGYIVTQIPGGQLARKFGGKVMFLVANFIGSILSILTPICADIGDWKLLFAVRFVQGLSQGVLFPSTHTILSKWITIEERGPLGTYTYSGCLIGTVLMLASSGFLASSFLGWPSTFYIPGAFGLAWSTAWLTWGASSPNDYKAISIEEKNLIESSLRQNEKSEKNDKVLSIPWTKFFSSRPVLVLILAHITFDWGFLTLLTQIPTYMKSVLAMDIKENALLSALPYAAMFMMCFLFSGMAAWLNKYISVSTSRKVFNTIGYWIPMVTMICLGYVDANQINLAVILLTITVGVNAAPNLGFMMNHIDLSPNFAGILMGISNFFSNMMGIVGPLLCGVIVTDEKDPAQWRIIFLITAATYFFGNLFFILFGTAEIQPWNDPVTKTVDDPEAIQLKQTN